jgi:hypothetical protein
MIGRGEHFQHGWLAVGVEIQGWLQSASLVKTHQRTMPLALFEKSAESLLVRSRCVLTSPRADEAWRRGQVMSAVLAVACDSGRSGSSLAAQHYGPSRCPPAWDAHATPAAPVTAINCCPRPLSILTQTTPDRPADVRVASTASSVQCTGAGGVVVAGTLAAPLRTRRKRPMDGVRLDWTGRVQAFQPYEPFQPPSAGRSPRTLQRLACDYLWYQSGFSHAAKLRAHTSRRLVCPAYWRIAPMSVDPARRKAGGWLGAPECLRPAGKPGSNRTHSRRYTGTAAQYRRRGWHGTVGWIWHSN